MEHASCAAALDAFSAEVGGCERCALAGSRTRVVFGEGPVGAALMLVGEAPGFAEDRLGMPLAGQAGALVRALLEGVAIDPGEVYVANVLKCRPPGNRDPEADEIAACEAHLFRQVELVRPRVIATLGTLATRVLSGRPHGITSVHGQPQDVTIGALPVTLLPLYHPAAALYTPAMREILERDVARIPVLLGRAAAAGSGRVVDDEGANEQHPSPREQDGKTSALEADPVQLGLF